MLAMMLGLTSHAVLARPWHDHQLEAQAIVRAAACAGANQLIQGGSPLEIKRVAIYSIAQGIRSVHGYEIMVAHTLKHHQWDGRDFLVSVQLTYRNSHFLLEELIDYQPSWKIETATVTAAKIDRCAHILPFQTQSARTERIESLTS